MSSYEAAVGQELGEFGELGELGEGELELGDAGELGELELEGEFEGEGELAGEERFLGSILGLLGGQGESGLNEAQELELASELLEINNEQELEQFLGSVFKKVVSGVGSFMRSPAGRALGGVLKNVAKKALPMVGGAIGSFVAPGVGTAIGSKLGSLASGLLEVSPEAMPAEQAELEVARRVVRLAASSARQLAAARPPRPVNPRTLARAAVARAARTYAPRIYRAMLRSLRAGARVPRHHPHPWRPRPIYGQAVYPGAPVYVNGAAPYPPEPSYDPDYAPAPVAPVVSGAPGPAGVEPAPAPIPAVTAAPYGGVSGRWVRRGRKIILFGV